MVYILKKIWLHRCSKTWDSWKILPQMMFITAESAVYCVYVYVGHHLEGGEWGMEQNLRI